MKQRPVPIRQDCGPAERRSVSASLRLRGESVLSIAGLLPSGYVNQLRRRIPARVVAERTRFTEGRFDVGKDRYGLTGRDCPLSSRGAFSPRFPAAGSGGLPHLVKSARSRSLPGANFAAIRSSRQIKRARKSPNNLFDLSLPRRIKLNVGNCREKVDADWFAPLRIAFVPLVDLGRHDSGGVGESDWLCAGLSGLPGREEHIGSAFGSCGGGAWPEGGPQEGVEREHEGDGAVTNFT